VNMVLNALCHRKASDWKDQWRVDGSQPLWRRSTKVLLDRFVYIWLESHESCDIHRPPVSSFKLCSRWPNSSCIHGHSSTILPKIILIILPNAAAWACLQRTTLTSFHPIDISDIAIKTLSVLNWQQAKIHEILNITWSQALSSSLSGIRFCLCTLYIRPDTVPGSC
jgi:hypothetical protein